MTLDRYTILHRKDERGVIVESGTFGPDDEIPEGFEAAAYEPIYAPREDHQEPVAESVLTQWESPVAKGTFVVEDTEALADAVDDLQPQDDDYPAEPELDEGSPREAREQSEDGELTGAEEEVDESLESDEDDSDDEAEVDDGTPRQAREDDLTDAEEEQDESAEASESTAPPQGGPGSGKDAWAQYAASQNVDVPQDVTRDDIIDAVKKAGKPV